MYACLSVAASSRRSDCCHIHSRVECRCQVPSQLVLFMSSCCAQSFLPSLLALDIQHWSISFLCSCSAFYCYILSHLVGRLTAMAMMAIEERPSCRLSVARIVSTTKSHFYLILAHVFLVFDLRGVLVYVVSGW